MQIEVLEVIKLKNERLSDRSTALSSLGLDTKDTTHAVTFIIVRTRLVHPPHL